MSRKSQLVAHRTQISSMLAALAILGVAGCSNGNDGTPEPTSSFSSGDSTSSTTSNTQSTSDEWFRSVNACNLVDQSTATGLGYAQPGQTQDGQSFNCAWTATDGSVFSVVLEDQSYDSIQANMGQLSDVTVGGRPAKLDTSAGGDPHGCDVALQATQGSRALVTVHTLSTTAAEACSTAQAVGTAIAPKLPKASS
jgi:hypothetical protein